MIRLIVALVILFCTAPALPEAALAATKYLDNGASGCTNPDNDYNPTTRACGSGSDIVYTDRSDAFDQLGASNTLIARAGTYTDDCSIGTIESGVSGNPTIITKLVGEFVHFKVAPGTRFCLINFNVRSYISLKGIIGDRDNFVWDGDDQGRGDNLITDVSAGGTGIVIEYLTITKTLQTCIFYAGNNLRVTGNHIHNCGTVDIIPADHAIYVTHDNNIIENNELHNTSGFGVTCFDSGLPTPACDNIIIRGNLIYNFGQDASHWSGIGTDGINEQIYKNVIRCNGVGQSGIETNAAAVNVVVYHNSTTNCLYPLIIVSGSSGTIVKNNISYGNTNAFFNQGTGTVFDDNLCGGAGTGCEVIGNPLFVDAANNDLSLQVGSPAINAATPISGLPCNPHGCDIGAFQTFTCITATVNENFLDNTCAISVHTPIQPASGITGITALLSAVARTTLSSIRLPGSDSIIRTQFNGAACVGGGAWTSTYVPGNITDSALIGWRLNQKAFGHVAQVVTNQCGTAPPGSPGTPLIIYGLGDAGATAVNTGSSGAADNGTWSGTFTPQVTGKNGFGVALTDLTAGSLAIPHGNAINPSSQSFTVAFWVNVPANLIGAQRTYFGHSGVAGNRLYISTFESQWRIGIQGSNDGTASNHAVIAGWNRACLSSSSVTDTATLYINGVAGTAGAAKSFTSYALPSDLTLGSPFGAGSNPGVTYDDLKWWDSAEDCVVDYLASEPPSPPASGTLANTAFRIYGALAVGGSAIPMAAPSTNAFIAPRGSFTYAYQTDCTITACSSLAEKLYYTCPLCPSAGALVPIPDVLGPDQFSFVGVGADINLLSGPVAACVSGGLTPNPGETQHTASAVPVFTLAQNNCIAHRGVLQIGASAGIGWQYCIKPQNQTGVALNSYTPAGGGCVTTITPFSSGFASRFYPWWVFS